MLDKLRFNSTLFAHLHQVAEGPVLRLGSHKIPSAFDQVSTHTLTVILHNTSFCALLQPYTLGRLNGINE